MNQDTAQKILKDLVTWYPRAYPQKMSGDRALQIIQELMDAYEPYYPEAVVNAYITYRRSMDGVPTIAAIKRLLSAKDLKASDAPETWSGYFEDEDGYGYAISSKTKEYDCIWKPTWKEDRIIESNGETIFLPKKLKSEVLKAHGIIK